MKNYQSLGKELVWRLMLRMSLPVMGLLLLHALLEIVDTWFISQLGAQPLAAVTLCRPVQVLLLAVAAAAGTGVHSIMARSLGKNQEDLCNNLAWHTLFLGVGAGVFFTWAGFHWMDSLLPLMGAGSHTMEQCQTYLRFYLWAVPGLLMPILLSGLVAGEGNTVLPLAVGLLEKILDVVLDALFIRGWGVIPPLGLRGAATASILSQSIGALLYIFVLRRNNSILRWNFRDFSPQLSILREIFRVGLPGLLPELLSAGMLLLLNRMLMHYGYVEVASLGLLLHIRAFCLLPAIGLGQGSLPIAGFAFGSGSFDRLKEVIIKGMAGSLLLLTVGWMGVQLYPQVILRWFSEDALLVGQSLRSLQFGTLFLPLAGPFLLLLDFLQITGMSLTAMGFSLLRIGCLQIPLLLWGAYYWGSDGIWSAFALTDLVAAAFLPGFLRIFWNRLTPTQQTTRQKHKSKTQGMSYTLRRLHFWLKL